MNKYCFGVDLGGTTVKIGLFSIEGQLQDKWEIPTRTENHGAEILSDIAASIQRRMDTGHLSKEQVTGIGIGVPGPVLNENIVQGCVNLGWGNVRVADELSALTGLKVKAANDANVAALGEQWQGGGKGFQNLVMFTLGTGVGGGIIQNGRIISGANGAAGEIGHMVIVDSDEVVGTCGCGHRGCLEQVASATGIVNLTEKKLAECSQDSDEKGQIIFTADLPVDGKYYGKEIFAPDGFVTTEEVLILSEINGFLRSREGLWK